MSGGSIEREHAIVVAPTPRWRTVDGGWSAEETGERAGRIRDLDRKGWLLHIVPVVGVLCRTRSNDSPRSTIKVVLKPRGAAEQVQQTARSHHAQL